MPHTHTHTPHTHTHHTHTHTSMHARLRHTTHMHTTHMHTTHMYTHTLHTHRLKLVDYANHECGIHNSCLLHNNYSGRNVWHHLTLRPSKFYSNTSCPLTLLHPQTHFQIHSRIHSQTLSWRDCLQTFLPLSLPGHHLCVCVCVCVLYVCCVCVCVCVCCVHVSHDGNTS